MKVKHRWHHTVTMCYDLVITITWWGNALEHDDLSALSWPRVFLKIIWLQMIPYIINKKNSYLVSSFGSQKNDFFAQLYLLRAV